MSETPFALAVREWQAGRVESAERACRQAMALDAAAADPYRLLAEICASTGRTGQAIEALTALTARVPNDAAAWRQLADLHARAGAIEPAIAAAEQSLVAEPDHPRGLNNLGHLLIGAGRPEQALPCLRRAIAARPDYAIAHNNLGLALARLDRLDEAIVHYGEALALNPDFAQARSNLSVAERRRAEARAARARAADPSAGPALLARVHELLQRDEVAAALAACDEAMAHEDAAPRVAGLAGLRASALLALDRVTEALAAATDAVAREPGDAQAWIVLGHARLRSDLALPALEAFDAAAALPHFGARAHAGRGLALEALGRADEAIAAFERSVSLDPTDADVFERVGSLMLTLGRHANAQAAFAAARERDPGRPGLLEGEAAALCALGRHEEAVPLLEELGRRAASTPYLAGNLLHARLHCCLWEGLEAVRSALYRAIDAGDPAETPFGCLAHSTQAAVQLRCARLFTQQHAGEARGAPPRDGRAPRGRLRIGYLSADFTDHPVGQLMAPVLEAHDRGRFEIVALSAGARTASALRQRIERSVDAFVDVSALSDADCAAVIRARELDVLVDLGGHTAGSRTPVLAFRPAPVQVSYLGYPGTLGADYVDYLLADRHVIPAGLRGQYAEQIVELPHSYFPGARPGTPPAPVSRAQAGLPEAGVVFCAFNAPYKFTPAMFDTWMRILTAVPDSVLWLRELRPATRQRLAARAAQGGVSRSRLVYAPRVPTHDEHLARLACADLFLDTYPYNAHTTASDALSVAVGVLTLAGETFASRVATSLLHACGLGDLSMSSLEAYERYAIEVGNCEATRRALEARVASRVARAPLFATEGHCRALEAAYEALVDRHARGLPPGPLAIAPPGTVGYPEL